MNELEKAAYDYINSDAVEAENMQLAFGDFIAGAQWMKERMMKDAVDGVVHHFFKDGVAAVHYTEPANHEMSYYMSANGFLAGDKVKIIVIKEDAK